MMRRTPRFVGGAMALALLAAACSDDDDPVTETGAVDDAGDDMAGDDMADDDMSDGTHIFRVTLTNTSDGFPIAASGAQAVPSDGTEAGPALPGSGYEFTVPRSAPALSFATMFVQSNDWFVALVDVPLYDEAGQIVSGDLTEQLPLPASRSPAHSHPGG